MTASIDRGLLRHVGLCVTEVKTIDFVASRGGEVLWRESEVKPATIMMINGLIGKGLLERQLRHDVGRVFLRLTDQGRSVAAQLEVMSAAPRIEVARA